MKVVIFASGRGSNANAIFSAVKNGKLKDVSISALVSDNKDAPALKIAENFGVKAVYLDPMRKGARFTPESEKTYIDFVEKENPDLIVLAGFMRILPADFVKKFGTKTINLHPSLLPAYKGINPIKRAFDAGEKECGCTVHYVTEELDSGAIIAQAKVSVDVDETLETLEAKIHLAEHELLVNVIANLSK